MATYDDLNVDIGNAPNDDQGDPLRTAFDKINQRFAELRVFLNNRGDWAPNTAYTANPNRDWVIVNGVGYLATSNHTSGATFAADLAAGKWVEADALLAIQAVDTLRADLASAAAGEGAELVAFRQAGAGAVNRTASAKMRESVSVLDFGAVGDLAQVDTVAFQNALNTNKNVLIPAATGYRTGGKITSAASGAIIGDGFFSALYPTSLPVNTDALVISPPADGNAREYFSLDGVYILQSTGGRHAVMVDISTSGQRLSRFLCHRSYLRSNGTSNYAFKINNPANSVDRFFVSTFSQSVFDGGLNLDGVGDSINVTENTFTGQNEGLIVRQTTNISSAGAGDSSMCVIERNNSTANKGIYIVDAQSPKIRNNNFECGAGPGAGAAQALINLEGVTQRIFGAEITGNAILHAPHCTTGVYVGQTDNALIENNIFGIAATGYAIVVSENAKNTIIGVNSYNPKNTGREVLDLGVGTKGVIKTPTLQNGWTNVGAPYKTAQFVKSKDSFVSIEGVIAGSTVAANTVLFTLPFGFRPEGQEHFSVHGLSDGGVWGHVNLRIDPDGSVRLRNFSAGVVAMAELSICGVRFYAPDVV